MRTRLFPLAVGALFAGLCAADEKPAKNPGPDAGPVEINASQSATYSNGIAIARGDVSIERGGTNIYADYGEYRMAGRIAILVGNVRIYRDGRLILADRATYHLDTGAISTEKFDGAQLPFLFSGATANSAGKTEPLTLTETFLTTHDSSKPDFHLAAKTVVVYPDDRVVYKNVRLYLGQTPIFWLPYFVTSVERRDNDGFEVTPGQSSTNGAFLLTRYGFPLTNSVTGQLQLDVRTRRGVAAGLNFFYKPYIAGSKRRSPLLTGLGGDEEESASTPTDRAAAVSQALRSVEGGQFLTYFLEDQDPNLNRTGLPRDPVSKGRYRLAAQDIHFFSDDFYFKLTATKLSDKYLLEDFFRRDVVRDPQPDNQGSLTWRQDRFVVSLVTRIQLNNFFDVTERLPELSIEFKRQELAHLGVFYEGETSAGYLRRNFASDGINRPDYAFFRFDSFHQFTVPRTFFGWLNIVPRAGFRLTYYSATAPSQAVADQLTQTTFNAAQTPAPIPPFQLAQSLWRPLVNLGFESSFKVSRVYNIQSRLLGLDRLQHIVQPYVNFSYVENLNPQTRVPLPADRRQPTTALDPIDFPQFTAIDSIRPSTVARIGVRQRFQTKRDALTFNWLELDSYFQRNFRNPYSPSTTSNFFQGARFRPVPWVAFTIDAQFPLLNRNGFTELNTAVRFMPASNTEFEVGHRYLSKNPFFPDSSLLTYRAYYRVDENWAVGVSGRYEYDDRTLENQTYTIYRDLTSFVGSISAVVNNNRRVNDVGFILTFTLKDLPKVSESLNVNPGQSNPQTGY